jgi:hypothetical protein
MNLDRAATIFDHWIPDHTIDWIPIHTIPSMPA